MQLTPGVTSDGAQDGSGNGYAAPGTQTGPASGGGGNLGASSSIFATESGASANTNGQQFENNGFTVDGISTVSAVWGGRNNHYSQPGFDWQRQRSQQCLRC